MRPEVLQNELLKILENSFVDRHSDPKDDVVLSLNEDQMFKLWNILGEELGIDLSLATEDQRKLLFDACDNGKHIAARDFSSLLWLVYYSDAAYQ
ncbi:hypothetical protein GCL60_11760 [Silvanigrella paludirubra]|jgi:hypothetical protein|uniref:Uncharacterized protein n=1 Tax=Silvanigrella paludirubra TaxID=2499159 RepID=A0A6N6VQK5_9BACT|nr:hypothetical protein [Silvanigrella paludirubra]KAB8037844.1 hypothetical protein GCL60_11760 [Silvanigrella paludirubra]MBX9839708.1 hypothetical protein [Silvanigrellaceae bacterium]